MHYHFTRTQLSLIFSESILDVMLCCSTGWRCPRGRSWLLACDWDFYAHNQTPDSVNGVWLSVHQSFHWPHWVNQTSHSTIGKPNHSLFCLCDVVLGTVVCSATIYFYCSSLWITNALGDLGFITLLMSKVGLVLILSLDWKFLRSFLIALIWLQLMWNLTHDTVCLLKIDFCDFKF